MEMDEAPTRLRRKPSWLIGRVSARAHRLIGETMAAAGGHAYHFAILAALDEFGPNSQVRIGQRCGIDQSDMHAMLNELTEQGHVARTPDPGDRRRNLITLTDAGQALARCFFITGSRTRGTTSTDCRRHRTNSARRWST